MLPRGTGADEVRQTLMGLTSVGLAPREGNVIVGGRHGRSDI
jgi:hypothetical protein